MFKNWSHIPKLYVKNKCNVLINGKECNGSHHSIIHDAYGEGLVLHSTHRFPSLPTETLLMVYEVDCLKTKVNAILDPCSNISLITHSAAQTLNLRGKEISVVITKVGNTTERIQTREYHLTIRDISGKLWRIRAYGIDEITSSVTDINFLNVFSLFTTVSPDKIRRPVGMIDLLIGLDYCNLIPDKVEEVGNLQLMDP